MTTTKKFFGGVVGNAQKRREQAARQGHEPLYSIEDMAERYQVHKQTILRWVEIGQLPQPIRIGRRHRWRFSEVVQAENRLKISRRGMP